MDRVLRIVTEGVDQGGEKTLKGLTEEMDKFGLDVKRLDSSLDDWINTLKAASPASQAYAKRILEITAAFKNGEMSAEDARQALEGIRGEMNAAAGSAQKFGLSLTDIKSGIDLAIGTLRTIGETAKQAFDFAKEGAELDYSRDKFDRLAKSIGTTSSALMADLKTATRGMVTDAELVASAVDFMSLGLVKTREEAVRLTKAAGALGMNMNQLVLTLTNQTTMRFDALGVSVDGFAEKVAALKQAGMSASDAFREAFLQQAEQQIALLGEKADSGAAAFARFETTTKNLGDAMKRNFYDSLLPILPLLDDITEAVNRNAAIAQRADEIMQDGETNQRRAIYLAEQEYYARNKVTQATKGLVEYELAYQRALKGVTQAAGEQELAFKSRINPAVDELNKKLEAGIYTQDSYTRKIMELANAKQLVAGASDWSAQAVQRYGYEAYAASTKVEPLIEKSRYVSEKLSSVSGAANSAAGSLGKMIDQTNRNIGSAIADMMEDMRWLMAGGGKIEEAFAAVKTAVQEGKITPMEGQKYLEGLFLAATDLQLDLDQITADQAAKNIEETLNVKLEKAKKMVQELIDKSGSTINLDVLINFVTHGLPMSGPRQYPPANRSGPRPVEQASGGDWWVTRPTLFLAGEAGPERATFTPAGKLGAGDGANITVNLGGIYGNADPQVVHQAAKDGARAGFLEAQRAAGLR